MSPIYGIVAQDTSIGAAPPTEPAAPIISIFSAQNIIVGKRRPPTAITATIHPAIILQVGKRYSKTITLQTSHVASVTQDLPVKAFIAHRNSIDQTGIADVTYTQITGLVEQADVGNLFASTAWVPPAGKVRVGVLARGTGTISNTTGNCGCAVFKNGASFGADFAIANTNDTLQMCAVVDDIANGTDSYTARIYIDVTSGTGTVSGASYYTRFWGYYIGT